MEEKLKKSGSIPKTYLELAMPVVFGMMISIIYNIADTYFVARTGDTSIVAAVSLCGPLFVILMAFGNIFGQGGSSLISRLLGEKAEEKVKHVSAFCFYGAIGVGAIIGLLLVVLNGPVLKLLGANEETLYSASRYYMVMAVGAPAVVASFVHNNLLRCEGKAFESMIGHIGGLLVNIILDPVFILGLNMGAFGAALASVIGYAATTLYLLFVVLKKSKVLSVNIKNISCEGDHIFQIATVGFSAALANWMSSIALIITNRFLLKFGTNNEVAAMGVAGKVSMIVMLIITGLSFGGAPLIGYFCGSHDKDSLKKLFKFMFTFICSLAAGLSLILIALAPILISFFMKDETIVRLGAQMLRFNVSSMAFMAVVLIVTISHQSFGKPLGSTVLSLCRQGIIFLAVITLLTTFLGYTGILLAQPVSDVLTCVLALVLFKKNILNA
ncbi:MAG: MATE family efflux transporter [Lachnospiraceae bacterium]|nr:MATE family efflux transporter [Lachnospiraceae bacterium]